MGKVSHSRDCGVVSIRSFGQRKDSIGVVNACWMANECVLKCNFKAEYQIQLKYIKYN